MVREDVGVHLRIVTFAIIVSKANYARQSVVYDEWTAAITWTKKNRKWSTVNRGVFTQVGEISQSLNFKYLYKSHCKPNEMLWKFEGYHII